MHSKSKKLEAINNKEELKQPALWPAPKLHGLTPKLHNHMIHVPKRLHACCNSKDASKRNTEAADTMASAKNPK